jgi:hypothetical protein
MTLLGCVDHPSSALRADRAQGSRRVRRTKSGSALFAFRFCEDHPATFRDAGA